MLDKARRKLKKRGFKEELVTQGRRRYGAIYRRSDGSREIAFYLAWRKPKDIFRDGEKTNSDAIRSGKALWAIDYETLMRLRRKEVHVIGILDQVNNEVYWTTLSQYLDSTIAKPRDYERRGGAMQRYMPFHQFRVAQNFLRNV